MKKIFLLLAFAIQFSIAQTNPVSGEYISIEKPAFGINLLMNNDNTYQIVFLSGKYSIVNDTIRFEKNIEENAFNLKFEKGKSAAKEITVFTEPANVFMILSGTYLGVQEKENGAISYKSINEYFDENLMEEYTQSIMDRAKDGESEVPKKIAFTLPRPYALYFVRERSSTANIEKYVVPSDVNTVSVEGNSSIFSDIEMTGVVNEDKTLSVTVDRSPLKFQNKNSVPKTNAVQPTSKTREKNWTFPGKKDLFNNNADSTDVTFDNDVEVEEYNNADYKFSAKVETNFEDAIKNLKSKYLVVYYNPKSKKIEKEFESLVDDYNTNISYDMYEGYDADYDKLNFYLANSKDEKFLKANGITSFPVTVILDDKKQVLASSSKRYSQVVNDLSSYDFTDKVEAAQKSKQIDEIVGSKKFDSAKFMKLLSSGNRNFYTRNTQLSYGYETIDVIGNVGEYIATPDTTSVVSIGDNDESSFTFYKFKMSQEVFNQKLKDLFVSFHTKKEINEELIGVLLNEIDINYNSLLFFEKNNSIAKEDINKYLGYALTYNGDNAKKVKILNAVSEYIMNLENKNEVEFEAISKKAMISSNYNGFQTKTYVEVVANQKSELGNLVEAVNQYYNKVNANQSLFENINKEFEDVNEALGIDTDWDVFKNLHAEVLSSASNYVLRNASKSNYNDVQKWLDCAVRISKNNVEVNQVLFDFYSEIGNTSKANETKAKLDTIKAKNDEENKF